MKLVILAVGLGVTLSACAVRGTGEVFLSEAEVEAKDDGVCRGFGAKPGTQPYIECRLRLRTDRSNQDSARRFR